MPGNVKFLLVDDLADNLVALEALLERDGLELYTARSGRQALELLLVHDFALALVDVQMPEMDGFELAETMRGVERSKHVPIIFVTAGRREQNRVFRGYETGAVDFLFKPVDAHILKHKADVFFQLYRQKQQLAEQIAERERLVGEMKETLRLNETFTAALGHDLRNPLGAIMSNAEMLIRRAPDEKTVTSARRVLSSGARMARMIEQLLDLARARLAGGIPVTRSEVDLRVLAERVVAEHQATAPGRALAFEAVGSLRGQWDEARVAQILSNLVANALRHGRPEGRVSVRVDGRSAGEVLLAVGNDGAIAPEILPHIFDPFRSGSGTVRRGEGLGLGLYIVDQLVKAHGGSTQVRSSEAEGTTFEVRMPRSPPRALTPAAGSAR
jgi:signal transduction histidine kinase